MSFEDLHLLRKMGNVTTKERIAYTEVLYLLKSVEKEYYDKIPKELIELFEENSLDFYLYYDENGNLKQSDLTLEILSYINLEYWSDEEKKKELLKKYKEIDKKINEELDPFKNRKRKEIVKNDENKENEENTQMTVYSKEKWYMKFINKLKKIFKKSR